MTENEKWGLQHMVLGYYVVRYKNGESEQANRQGLTLKEASKLRDELNQKSGDSND